MVFQNKLSPHNGPTGFGNLMSSTRQTTKPLNRGYNKNTPTKSELPGLHGDAPPRIIRRKRKKKTHDSSKNPATPKKRKVSKGVNKPKSRASISTMLKGKKGQKEPSPNNKLPDIF